jgi:hypothetical protein
MVFPTAEALKLDKSIAPGLTADGGLADSHNDISVTAGDAMAECEKLGERYLRVDALCIFEDDVDDREQQIQRTDFVYKGAILTVVDGAALYRRSSTRYSTKHSTSFPSMTTHGTSIVIS